MLNAAIFLIIFVATTDGIDFYDLYNFTSPYVRTRPGMPSRISEQLGLQSETVELTDHLKVRSYGRKRLADLLHLVFEKLLSVFG
jgi:hypothetical protein